MALDTQVVCSKGIYHGLPVFTESAVKHQGLTAIVAGANGMTGYHMVKVLAAAPQRWQKIYCLSRSSPPANFYSDLGEGRARVEHVKVDFMSQPDVIGEILKTGITRVDYVFFFSYLQPEQKGNVLGMWSNADELLEVNSALLNNFLGGLNLATLKPKRFLLQTGAKHYGFHMGSAFSPSLESDHRVTLESNFYYAQEDALFEYCKNQGVEWNVVRPSYIIGAVRDSALNHLIGLTIYAAVQARRRQPLAFPGDYTVFDREHCQSTAMLNSYMEEWVVLTPRAANEAFNMQDGQPFTWGRFWSLLAQWYGTTWTPPEEDELKYTTYKSRHGVAPRGYGAGGNTRSTFSFLQWSQDPEVQSTFDELAQEHHLIVDLTKNRAQIFGSTDSAVIGGWPLSLSMRKARCMGWLGTVDSYEASFNAIKELVALKLSVPMVKDTFEI